MTIPCKDCLLVPSCRHKRYMTLFEDCILLRRHIPFHDHTHRRDIYNMNNLQDLLKPSRWIFGPKISRYYSNSPLVQERLDINEEASKCNLVGHL